jgi:lipoprotein-releasing system permease protein
MNYKLIYKVSWALLTARWKQTLIAAIGVTFSITMFITLLSFMTGLNNLLDGLVLNRTPHIRIYNELKANKEQPVSLYYTPKDAYHFIYSVKPKNDLLQIHNLVAIEKTLKKDSRVLDIAPKIITQIFYNIGTTTLTGVINGIDVEAENKLFFFNDYITAGNYIDLKNIPNSIILGKGVAEKMLVNIGDVIQISTNTGENFQLKVVGFFQSGLQEIDKTQSYTSLGTAQKLLAQPNTYVTDLQVKLNDITMAPTMSKEYEKLFNTNAMDIQTANAQFETGTFIRTLISYAVGITLLVVAGFGIYNILNMLIYEKMDSIAILKATGFSGNDVQKIFIGIALTIGIIGGFVGLILGLGLSSIISHIPFNTAALPTVKTYPVAFNIKFYIIASIFSVVTTYFAGYFPSRKASKIDPVIIIRGK